MLPVSASRTVGNVGDSRKPSAYDAASFSTGVQEIRRTERIRDAYQRASDLSFLLPLFFVCGVDKPQPAPRGPAAGALTSPSVSTNLSTYAPGATITVTYAGLPGNLKTGSRSRPPAPPTRATSTSCTRTARPAAPRPSRRPPVRTSRAFSNDTFTLVAQSPAFTVSRCDLSTDQAATRPARR